jgi:hypothetical protein
MQILQIRTPILRVPACIHKRISRRQCMQQLHEWRERPLVQPGGAAHASPLAARRDRGACRRFP